MLAVQLDAFPDKHARAGLTKRVLARLGTDFETCVRIEIQAGFASRKGDIVKEPYPLLLTVALLFCPVAGSFYNGSMQRSWLHFSISLEGQARTCFFFFFL